MDENNNTQGLTGHGHNSDPSLVGLGNDEISVQIWLRARFQEKEDLLAQFYNIHNQRPPPPPTTVTTNTTTTSTIPIGTCNSTTVLLPIATPIHNNSNSGTSSCANAYTDNNTNNTNNTNTTYNTATTSTSNKDQSNTSSNTHSNTSNIIPWPKLLTTNNTIDIYAIIIMCICIIYITISLLLSSIFRWIYTCIFVIYACFRLVDGFDRLELFLHCDMLVSEGLGQTGIDQNYDHLRNINIYNNERWNSYRMLTQSRTGQRS